MQKILLAGDDLRLLETRAAVLSRTGASVVCWSADEALARISRGKFDLVVLCHTIPDAEARMLSHEIRRLWPQTRIVQVVSGVEGEKVYEGVEVDAMSAADPGRLIRCTTELLDEMANHASVASVEERRQNGDRTVPVRAVTRVVGSVDDSGVLSKYYRGRLLRSIDREGERRLGRGHQNR
jgi:CheY-like chemotaxis protein